MRLRGTNRNFRRVSNQQVPFNPMKLFRNGEQGVHYDPSDFSRYMQTGPELVTGTWQTPVGYDNITTGSGSSFSTTGAGSPSRVAQVVTTVATPGRPYRVSFRVVSTTATVSLFVRDGTVEGLGTVLATTNAVVGSIQTLSFFAASAAVNLLFTTGASANYSIDNISVRELTALDSCTLFQDSAGTTPVTAVEQPVGLMLDKRLGLVLGPELVTNGDFSNGTTGWAVTGGAGGVIEVVSGELEATSTGGGILVSQALTTVVGKTYALSVAARSGTYIGATVGPATTSTATPSPLVTINSATKPVYRLIFTATQTTTYISIRFPTTTAGNAYFDNISVRELPGNHAFQTTAIDRPVLRNRYNLLTKTEQFDDAAWSKSASGTGVLPVVTANFGTDPNGFQNADRVQLDSGAAGSSMVAQSFSTTTARHEFSVWLRSLSGSVTVTLFCLDNIQNVTVSTTWQRFTFARTPAALSAIDVRIAKRDTWSSSGAADLLVWGASLLPADQSTLPYQRVNTSTDYDADHTKFPLYLAANGTNTWMQTNSIDFTGTDKVTVFAGLRKLSDAAPGIPFELSITSFSNNGAFTLIAPPVAGSPLYRVALRGTATYIETSSSNSYPASRSDVLSISLLIPGPTRTSLRINGALAATNNSSAGTGNFGNYPLYLFRRAGSQFPFNGNFYGLVIRGATTSDPDLLKMERWLSLKTGVQL